MALGFVGCETDTSTITPAAHGTLVKPQRRNRRSGHRLAPDAPGGDDATTRRSPGDVGRRNSGGLGPSAAGGCGDWRKAGREPAAGGQPAQVRARAPLPAVRVVWRGLNSFGCSIRRIFYGGRKTEPPFTSNESGRESSGAPDRPDER